MSIRSFALLFFPLLVAGMTLCACNVPTKIADEIAYGPDEITAKVNGVPYVFEVKGGTNYFGIHTSGTSGKISIGLHLGHGVPGLSMWTGEHTFMDSRPAASLNGVYATKDLGYLNVLQHDTGTDRISGTFEFATVDPSTKAPVLVTEGTFRIHYQTTD